MNFLLWGDGDPSSSWELDQYLKEKADVWTHIFARHPHRSYAQALQSPRIYQDQSGSIPRFPSNSNPDGSWLDGSWLNPGSIQGNTHLKSRAGSRQVQNHQLGQEPFYVRCLLKGHFRPDCKNRIRCRACNRWGHIARDCYFTNRPNRPNVSPQPTTSGIPSLIPRQESTVPAYQATQPLIPIFTLATASMPLSYHLW